MTRRTTITLNVLADDSLLMNFSSWSDADQAAYVDARTAEIRAFAALPREARQLILDMLAYLAEQGSLDVDALLETMPGEEIAAWHRRAQLAAPNEAWHVFLEALQAELEIGERAEGRR